MDGINKKILISIISYKEKDLYGTVKDAYEKAKNQDRLLFSIVEETYLENYSDLSFIPEDKIIYRKYDLSEYRGILWARNLTTNVDFEYDYILYICAHTRFCQDWDQIVIEEHNKAIIKNNNEKVVLTYCGADFSVDDNNNIIFNGYGDRVKNIYSPQLGKDFVPGYWFPSATNVPDDNQVHEAYWIHFTWCFATKQFVEEIPLDPEINFNAEEPYITIQAWCRGWRFFATSKKLYWHHTTRKYPGDNLARHMTHRPWVDSSKEKYWRQSDLSMIKLNLLLSGNLIGKYGDISKEQVLDFCQKSGMDIKYAEYNSNYDKLDLYQHGKYLKDDIPIDMPI
jgi:hypothetical protein